MRAILVLVGIGAIAYGLAMLLITIGFAVQVDPSLEGEAWRAAVVAKLLGGLKVGLIMSAGGFLIGLGLIAWVRYRCADDTTAPTDANDREAVQDH